PSPGGGHSRKALQRRRLRHEPGRDDQPGPVDGLRRTRDPRAGGEDQGAGERLLWPAAEIVLLGGRTERRAPGAEGGASVAAGVRATGVQAAAVNNSWYGMTSDGSVPSPAVDNGWDKELGGVRRWYGLPRGTSLYNAVFTKLFGTNTGLANVTGPWTLASDQVALELQNPAIASTNFENATGNGADGWKRLSYAQLSEAFDRGRALDPQFGGVNSDAP